MAGEFETLMIDVFDRITAMEQLALPGSEAFDYISKHSTSGSYPFWTNMTGGITPTGDIGGSEDYPYNVPIWAFLHEGFVSGGSVGGASERLLIQTHSPGIVQYFNQHRDLTYEDGPTKRPDFMVKSLAPVSASPIQEWNLVGGGVVWGVRFTFPLSFMLCFPKEC